MRQFNLPTVCKRVNHLAGYDDSAAPAKSRPWRLIACLVVVLASATAASYFLVDRTPHHFFVPNDEPLLIGLPLTGEAIYGEPDSEFIDKRSLASLRSGKLMYVIRNPIADHPIVIQFPAKAGYVSYGSNSYSNVEADAWPQFAQQTETIVIPPGGSRTFVDDYNVGMQGAQTWRGHSWCFVFTTDEAAGQQGEPYNGCLSFRAIMESPAEANESKNLARGEEQSSGSSETQ